MCWDQKTCLSWDKICDGSFDCWPSERASDGGEDEWTFEDEVSGSCIRPPKPVITCLPVEPERSRQVRQAQVYAIFKPRLIFKHPFSVQCMSRRGVRLQGWDDLHPMGKDLRRC